MVWEINMGVCPRLEFDNIMFINCPGYDFYIYGAFEFLCNSVKFGIKIFTRCGLCQDTISTYKLSIYVKNM